MTATRPYAHHLRYKLSAPDYATFRSRLTASVPSSRTTGIRSLRFASYRNSFPFLENRAADLHFSLHYYDDDPTYLRLVRQCDGESTDTIIAEAECRALLAGETGWLLNRTNPVLQDFYDCLTDQLLLPQVLLSYRREVFRVDSLDMWIALDTDIHSSLEHMHFLDPEWLDRDSSGEEGQFLLEVSYSDDIPDDVLCMLEESAPRRELLSSNYLTPGYLSA